MRIAVSGTHASGKSTLIDAFLARNPEYTCEPEPYAVLQELYGEVFGAVPTVDDFERQLTYQLERVERYSPGARVIFERSPVDFLAYMSAVASGAEIERWIADVRRALARLDLIVFLPIDEGVPIDVPEDEDPALRGEVDDRLREIFFGDELELSSSLPVVIEARGDVSQRTAAVERLLARG